MSEAPSPSSGQRFAHDLHRIREDRDVSLEELHEETKIPLGLLEQFEASGLFDHPMFNRVYLRSLVRTYARKVGLPIDMALDMLDHALSGDYAGELAAEYFGESVETTATSASEEATAPPDDDEASAAPAASEDEDAPPEEGKAVTEAGEPPAARKTPPMARTVDDVAASPGDPKPPPAPVRTPHSGIRRQWIIGGAVIMLLIALIVAIVMMSGDEDSRQDASSAPADDTVTTSAQEAVPLDAPTLPRTEATVGDTLDVLVVAADEPIQGIRITRDGDVRRPYWIEQGEALSVPVRQRIVIERGLDAIALYVEGYPYPVAERAEDDADRLVITRKDAEAFLERQSGSPSLPEVPTDTVAMPTSASP